MLNTEFIAWLAGFVACKVTPDSLSDEQRTLIGQNARVVDDDGRLSVLVRSIIRNEYDLSRIIRGTERYVDHVDSLDSHHISYFLRGHFDLTPMGTILNRRQRKKMMAVLEASPDGISQAQYEIYASLDQVYPNIPIVVALIDDIFEYQIQDRTIIESAIRENRALVVTSDDDNSTATDEKSGETSRLYVMPYLELLPGNDRSLIHELSDVAVMRQHWGKIVAIMEDIMSGKLLIDDEDETPGESITFTVRKDPGNTDMTFTEIVTEVIEEFHDGVDSWMEGDIFVPPFYKVQFRVRLLDSLP